MFSINDETPILRVLLVEDDKTDCNEISNCIDMYDDIDLTAITNNSTEALELTAQHLPDVVILDLELHHGGGNGLMYLHALPNLELTHCPYILVTTNNSSDITYETARQLGADFIMSKHEKNYSGRYVVDFLRMIHSTLLANNKTMAAHSQEHDSPDEKHRKLALRISRELDLVGINRKNVGYQYLVDAILFALSDSQENLISLVATKYQKSDVSVERAIQNAINRAWRTTPIEDLETHYTAKTHSNRGVPTLTEFIYYYTGLIKTGPKKF